MIDDGPTPAFSADSPRQPSVSIRARLRRETGASHALLDASFAGLVGPDGPNVYRSFVAVNAECHRVIEPLLWGSPFGAELAGLGLGPRYEVLSLDCEAMRIEPLDGPSFALRDPDVPQAAGIAYVIEGSRLGGRYLHRMLAERPDFAGASFHYLKSAAEDAAFRPLLDRIEALVEEPAARDRCVAAAERTFSHFLRVAELAGGAVSQSAPRP